MLHHLDSLTITTSNVGPKKKPNVMSFYTMLWQIDMDAVEAHRALTKAHHKTEMNAIGVPFPPPRSFICDTGKSDNARPFFSSSLLPIVPKLNCPTCPPSRRLAPSLTHTTVF